MAQISWQHQKVFGCMDHNLAWLYFLENGVFDGSTYVIHCRTSTIAYSRTLFLLIVEKYIDIEIECPYYHSTKRHWWMIYRIRSPQHQSPFPDSSLMLFYYGLKFQSARLHFIRYLICYTFKITTRCKERKALISKVGVLDFVLLIISIALSEIDMN